MGVLACCLGGCGDKNNPGGGDMATGPLVLELGFYFTPGTTPCTAPTTIHLHFVVDGANAGDDYEVMMAGASLPAMIDEPLPASLTVDKDYAIPMGTGHWSATVVSIAHQPAMTIPGGHLVEESSAMCP